MIDIKEHDRVKLKDGREGDVMDVPPSDTGLYTIDIGENETDWETIYVHLSDIEKVLK